MQQPAGRANHDVALVQSLALEAQVLAADDEAGRKVVVLAHPAERLEDLVGQLARRRDDQRAQPVHSRPPDFHIRIISSVRRRLGFCLKNP